MLRKIESSGRDFLQLVPIAGKPRLVATLLGNL
jgi:hypothetical protein